MREKKLRLLAPICVAVLAAAVRADTIQVPADQPTIQDAVDVASPGDTIVVGPGTYSENVDINVDLLTLIASGGPGSTRIESNAPLTPVVTISANGVTLGGTGQGFTIEARGAVHPDDHSGDAAIQIRGDQLRNGRVTIRNCVILGTDTDEGILVSPPVVGGHVRILENEFGAAAGAASHGFHDPIYFFHDNLPGVGWASAFDTTIDILGNVAVDYAQRGVNFKDNLYLAIVNITNCNFVGTGADHGIRFQEGLYAFSELNVNDVTIRDVEYGIEIDEIYDASTFDISECTLTDIHAEGISLGESTTRAKPA